MPHHRPRYDRSSGHDSSPSESSGGSDTDDDGPQRRRWTEYSLPGSRFQPQEGPDAITDAPPPTFGARRDQRAPRPMELQHMPTILEGSQTTGHHAGSGPRNRGGGISGSGKTRGEARRGQAVGLEQRKNLKCVLGVSTVTNEIVCKLQNSLPALYTVLGSRAACRKIAVLLANFI